MRKFEGAIFNEDVRNLVSNNRHHAHFGDVWADLNFIEVEARDPDEARAKLIRQYPKGKGFRVTEIYEL